jgi:hypothetical protein
MAAETKFQAKRLGGNQCHLISVPSHIKECGTNRGQYDCSRNGKVTYCVACKLVVTNLNWNTEVCAVADRPRANAKQPSLNNGQAFNNPSQRSARPPASSHPATSNPAPNRSAPRYPPKPHTANMHTANTAPRKPHFNRRRETLIPYKVSDALAAIDTLAIAAAGEVTFESENDFNRKKLARMLKQATYDNARTIKILNALNEKIGKIKGLADMLNKIAISDDNDSVQDDEEHDDESEEQEPASNKSWGDDSESADK